MTRITLILLCAFAVFFARPAYAACTNPAKPVGTITYDSTHYQFVGCTNTGWLALNPRPGTVNGLVAHWTLDEPSGTSAKDISSYNQTSTVPAGWTWQPAGGKIGGDLSGTSTANGNVATPSGLSASGITLAGWVKLPASTDYVNIFSDQWSGATGGFVLFIASPMAGTGAVFGVMQDASTQKTTFIDSVLVFNQWQHFAGTYDGTYAKIYVDGVLKTTNSYPGIPLVTTGPLKFAKLNGSALASFDDLRIYNRALSATEIAELAGMSNACTNPTGAQGTITYDTNTGTFVGCTPLGWTALHGRLVSDSGLVGWWKFDEASGTLKDSSGLGHDGTAGGSGITYAQSGRFGNAVAFNGNDDWVTVPDSNDWNLATKSATFSVWFKAAVTQTASSGFPRFLDHYVGGPIESGWRFGFDTTSTKLQFKYAHQNGLGDFIQLISPSTYNDNAWHNAVVTMDGSTAKLYVDGAYIIQDGYTDLLDYTQNLQIGGETGTSLLGSLDDIRIYQRALSATEVTQLYKGGTTCSNPAKAVGVITYDTNTNNFIGCTPAGWVVFGN